jgi:hypothetical protein
METPIEVKNVLLIVSGINNSNAGVLTMWRRDEDTGILYRCYLASSGSEWVKEYQENYPVVLLEGEEILWQE